MMLLTCSNSTTVSNCQIFAVLSVKLSTFNTTLREESVCGRNFAVFTVFGKFAKVYSHKK